MTPQAKKQKIMATTQRCVDNIRVLSADMVQQANSGHPGAPMGCAPMAHALWTKVMRYNPKNAKWTNRDRFVLSNGHACALQYVMLHLSGYEQMSMEQLKNFRQLGSITAGHPENHLVDAVEVSTGPLGQGISHAVGLAIAEQQLASQYNQPGFPIVDNHTFVICGDGCMQEGVAAEACSLAGHLGLGKLIVLYDDNKITIDGHTDKSFSEDVLQRFEAYGWHTSSVADGNHDVDAIAAAVQAAKAVTDKPSLIKVSTTIGLGSAKENTGGVHGSPLGPEDLANVKKKYNFDPEQTFVVDPQVQEVYNGCRRCGEEAESAWNETFAKYAAAHPQLAAEYNRRREGKLPEGWKESLPRYSPGDKALASRQYSQIVLQKCMDTMPEMIGGSADLTGSNGTKLTTPAFSKENRNGRYMHFGVREHGMAAICNGLAAYGMNFLPFGATFLNFIQYALGSVRVCAISNFRVLWIMSHDSVILGPDGPTHQPIETNALIRAMPNILLVRPADGNETSGAYVVALENTTRSTVLALSRQALPNMEGSSVEKVSLGGYVLQDCSGGDPDLILVGTGSEVFNCTEAAKQLSSHKVRVVSMPCMELFFEQSAEYQASVLPAGVPVVSFEAMSTYGWNSVAHASVGIDAFGVSAPGDKAMEFFGLTTENLVAKAKKVLALYPSKNAPDLAVLRSL